jgi:phenylacetate-CoA ligase
VATRIPFPGLAHRARSTHPLGPAMRRTLSRLDRAGLEELQDFQDAQLRRMVAWAVRRSPFYRSWFAENGVSPRDIRTQADLGLLPLIDRDHLSAEPERFCAYPRRLMWSARSSGTSGKVVTVYRTPGSSVYELAALERQWSWFGLPRGSRRVAMRAAGGDLGEVDPKVLAHEEPGANKLLVSGYVLGGADPERMISVVRDFEPDAVEGWPSSIVLFADMLDRRRETLPVQAVITSSEVMTSQQVELLRRAFEAPIVDHYGQTERVTLAGSCEAGGYHLFSDYAITELLPVPGRHDQWEIVGTPLHNWGFPLFRYRTGDTVGPAPEGPCACGRGFPRLGPIGGRKEDSFVSADGRTLPLPATIIDDLAGLVEAQIAQRAPGRFEVRLVPQPTTDIASVEAHALRNVETYFGAGQTVSFVVMDRIPRPPSGKLRAAILDPDPA